MLNCKVGFLWLPLCGCVLVVGITVFCIVDCCWTDMLFLGLVSLLNVDGLLLSIMLLGEVINLVVGMIVCW